MSINPKSYQITSSPSKRIRQELEKYKKSFERPKEYNFSYSSISASIYLINWDDIKGVEHSQGGSTSLFFCGFSNNEACIVKGLGNVVEDIFTNKLFSVMNIHVFNSRIISFTTSEFKKAVNAMRGVCLYNKFVDSKICKELDRPFFIVSEYVPGIYFLQMGKKRAENFFSFDSELGYQRLREIGEIIAMDVLINNSSRIPVIWNTEGNPNNFFVSVQGINLTSNNLIDPNNPIIMKNVFAIDSSAN
jgi:Actin-fragmin kinase, catalytic.